MNILKLQTKDWRIVMKCWHCDEEVMWNTDFSFEEYGYDGDGLVSILTCSNPICNAEYEIRLKIK